MVNVECWMASGLKIVDWRLKIAIRIVDWWLLIEDWRLDWRLLIVDWLLRIVDWWSSEILKQISPDRLLIDDPMKSPRLVCAASHFTGRVDYWIEDPMKSPRLVCAASHFTGQVDDCWLLIVDCWLLIQWNIKTNFTRQVDDWHLDCWLFIDYWIMNSG